MDNIEEKKDIAQETESVKEQEKVAEEVQAKQEREEDDDSDMPVQETKSYRQVVFTKPLFAAELHKVIDQLPYNTVFKNGDKQMKLTDLAKLMLPENGQVDVMVINQCISFLVGLPYALVREFMSYIESPQKQQQFWEVKTL